MLAEKRIENGIAVAGEIIAEPPHPIAAFRNEQLLIRKIPNILGNLTLSGH